MNNFHKQLEDSHNQTFWEPVYKKFFVDFKAMKETTEMEWQNKGVDRVITLKGGREIYVDEKVRENDYGDVCLEFESSYGKIGWMEKDYMLTDYIAYAVKDKGELKKVYFYDWRLLRAAWIENGDQWKKRNVLRAPNGTYTTLFTVVPYFDLYIKCVNLSNLKL